MPHSHPHPQDVVVDQIESIVHDIMQQMTRTVSLRGGIHRARIALMNNRIAAHTRLGRLRAATNPDHAAITNEEKRRQTWALTELMFGQLNSVLRDAKDWRPDRCHCCNDFTDALAALQRLRTNISIWLRWDVLPNKTVNVLTVLQTLLDTLDPMLR